MIQFFMDTQQWSGDAPLIHWSLVATDCELQLHHLVLYCSPNNVKNERESVCVHWRHWVSQEVVSWRKFGLKRGRSVRNCGTEMGTGGLNEVGLGFPLLFCWRVDFCSHVFCLFSRASHHMKRRSMSGRCFTSTCLAMMWTLDTWKQWLSFQLPSMQRSRFAFYDTNHCFLWYLTSSKNMMMQLSTLVNCFVLMKLALRVALKTCLPLLCILNGVC